ncbi:glycoside hydrolase family 2 protein [Georgenia phoenicis]|uniref:glycoside hydrolase family 2 protein n=1 Tax=unclassified Georgenia TaxID=2626815 RepID=UPI0039B0EC28
MLDSRNLGGTWTLRRWDDGPTSVPAAAAVVPADGIAARVPGAVHADLRAAGLILDPFIDRNELEVAWVGRTDWSLSRDIAWEGNLPERVDLVLDGVDTVATIRVGGTEVGRSRNMHRSYRYDVTQLLSAGTPTRLEVDFTSAFTEGEHWKAALGDRPNAYPDPFQFIRKMACSFGWDWGPSIVGAGLWRDVRLEGWSTARLRSVMPMAEMVADSGRLRLRVDLERAGSGAGVPLDVRVSVQGEHVGTLSSPPSGVELSGDLTVPGVRPWWPRGYGDQPLYDLTLELVRRDTGQVLDVWQRRTGFRTAAVDTSPDEYGTRFVLQVNDRQVLVKGVNWIPQDVMPGTLTRERYERPLRRAAAAGVNLVRVWGGGIYESRDFYELCDELGLLVWQDFLFACAGYPEDEPFVSEIAAEARDNVVRLAPHPSLVVWNGNNENLWLWDPADPDNPNTGELSWGEGYYLELLPRIVAELDPSRPYTAGSPWSGSWDHVPNDPNHQTFHSWEVWNRQDYTHYTDSVPRFVSEFGWQAPPAWATLRRSVSDDPLLPDSPGVLHHQKAEDGNGKLDRGMAPHVGEPASTEAWHYLTQLIQVRAVETGVHHWLSHWPRTAGVIVWQLNDLWPVTSWAAIDGDERLKPLYFALQEMFAPRSVVVTGREAPRVSVLNDTDAPWEAQLELTRMTLEGQVRDWSSERLTVAPRAVAGFTVPAALAALGADEMLVVRESAGARAVHLPLEPKETPFPEARLQVDVEEVDGGLDVHLSSDVLVRDVLLQADRLHPDASADRGFLTLLPGERATIRVRCPEPVRASEVHSPWVLTHLGAVLAGVEPRTADVERV